MLLLDLVPNKSIVFIDSETQQTIGSIQISKHCKIDKQIKIVFDFDKRYRILREELLEKKSQKSQI
jgi:predicted neuraminidase